MIIEIIENIINEIHLRKTCPYFLGERALYGN